MKTKKQLEKEIEKNILECPYNKRKPDNLEHGCSDCDVPNDELQATLTQTNEIIKFAENNPNFFLNNDAQELFITKIKGEENGK